MKLLRMALLGAILAGLLISGGCKQAIYFYSFKEEGNFGEEEEEWATQARITTSMTGASVCMTP